MGADGHITIYDWTKTVNQFPELETDQDLRILVIGYAYIYPNPFGEGELLVVYWGDNLYEPTFPGYEAWWTSESLPELRAKAIEIVRWMQDSAVIVEDWEVWT